MRTFYQEFAALNLTLVDPSGNLVRIGHDLNAAAWGKGYATEALTAIVDIAGDIGVRRLPCAVPPGAPGELQGHT